MIEREKGKDHEIVKEKTLGQPVVVKERKGNMMVMGKRRQHRQIDRRKGGYRRKPLQRKGIIYFSLYQGDL
jgi:hypothetical protein